MFSVIIATVDGQSPASEFGKLNWLEGSWVRTNARPGRSGIEKWTRVSDVELQGYGISLRGTDTTLVENLKLLVKEGYIYYVADVPENRSEVFFRLTVIGNNHFVCENAEHDFPKKIEYRLEGGALKATISGDGKSIDYWFKQK